MRTTQQKVFKGLICLILTALSAAQPPLAMEIVSVDAELQETTDQVTSEEDRFNTAENTDQSESMDRYALDRPRGEESPRGTKIGRYSQNGHDRAGWPCSTGHFAVPATNADFSVGYVGGGSLLKGEPRLPSEGTFGLDYAGHWFSRKTWLRWSHGRRYQGGAGAYATDGPKLHE